MDWHYGIAGAVHGPVSDGEMLELVRGRKVLPDTLVWAHFLEEWVPASTIEGLFAAAGVEIPAGTEKGTGSPWALQTPAVAGGTRPLEHPVHEVPEPAALREPAAPEVEPAPLIRAAIAATKRHLEAPVSHHVPPIATGSESPKAVAFSTRPIESLAAPPRNAVIPQPVSDSSPLSPHDVPKVTPAAPPELVPPTAEVSRNVGPASPLPVPAAGPTAGPTAGPPTGALAHPPPIPEDFSRPHASILEGEVVPSPFASIAPVRNLDPVSPMPPVVSPAPAQASDPPQATPPAPQFAAPPAPTPLEPPTTTLANPPAKSPSLPKRFDSPPPRFDIPPAPSDRAEPPKPASGTPQSTLGKPDVPVTDLSPGQTGAADPSKSPAKPSKPTMTSKTLFAAGRLAKLPALAKMGVLAVISAASAYGIHTYRGDHPAGELRGDDLALVSPLPPVPVALPPEKSLPQHLVDICPTSPGKIVLWDLTRASSQPDWVGPAPSDPFLDLLRNPVPLPAWIHEAAPEFALVAEFPIGDDAAAQVALIRFPKGDAPDFSAALDQSKAVPLRGGKELVPVRTGLEAEGSLVPDDNAVVTLDPRTFVIARTSTLSALFDQTASPSTPAPADGKEEAEPLSAPAFDDHDLHIRLVTLTSRGTVTIVEPQTATAASPGGGRDPGGAAGVAAPRTWQVTLLAADANAVTHEQVIVDSKGESVSKKQAEGSFDLDSHFGRILISAEIDAIDKASRSYPPSFPRSRVTAVPREVFAGEIAVAPEAKVLALDPIRYLPDRYRAVVSHNLKKFRENALFESMRAGETERPHYWRDLDEVTFGLKFRDLDRVMSCVADEGTVHVFVARFKLNESNFDNLVNFQSGYTVKGRQLYPIANRSPDTAYLCIIDHRTVIVGPGGMLERIIRNPDGISQTQAYMEELYPKMADFEESMLIRVEGRTADSRYQGVEALFFGENLTASGFDSHRIIKCSSVSMAEEFHRTMTRRREDALADGVEPTADELIRVGMDEGKIVVAAQVPAELWQRYVTYFKGVILPEES